MPGLVTRPARSHSSGSRQTTSPHSMCRPIGTPSIGDPEPATYGNRPHSCTVVPWYSTPGARWLTRPAAGTRQPHDGATGRRVIVDVEGLVSGCMALVLPRWEGYR